MARTVGSDGVKTEQAIRAAAVELIAKRGFGAVTLRQLAKQVGIQSGSVYRYFPSKADLLRTLLVEHLEELLNRWETEKPPAADPLALLKGFVAFHVRHHVAKRDEVFIGNMELRNLKPEDYSVVAGLRSRYEQILKDILLLGISTGRFMLPDIHVATYAILAMLTGVGVWYKSGGRLSKEDLVECYTKLVLEGVSVRASVSQPTEASFAAALT